MTDQTTNLLRVARELISAEGSWCHGWEDNGAVCAINATVKARDKLSHDGVGPEVCDAFENALCGLAKVMETDASYYSIGKWNDSHTHAEVLAAFDKAIAALCGPP
jgi:hypothetical protein